MSKQHRKKKAPRPTDAREKFMYVLAACQRLRIELNDERAIKDSVVVALYRADLELSQLRTLKSKKTKIL